MPLVEGGVAERSTVKGWAVCGMLSDIDNWKGCPRNIALEIESQEELRQKKMRHSGLGQKFTTHGLFTLYL